jgi:hypothetical protein
MSPWVLSSLGLSVMVGKSMRSLWSKAMDKIIAKIVDEMWTFKEC